ncbi:MAG: ParA family protein [Gallionellaceae bacterium]|nr:ParA family protein [Gallionellaceae bacterium]
MARILAITNQKGGVGKTTSAVNLAASLASLGRNVLLIDLDPQGNATTASGIDKQGLKKTVYHLLLRTESVVDVRVRSPEGGYDLLPANRDLAGAEVELVQEKEREFRLRQGLESAAGDYDFILIDCPPALNLLTVNALTCAHAVIIPMQCEYFAIEGLADLVNTIKKIKARLNPGLVIDGVVRVMFDTRNTLAQNVSDQLKAHFGAKVFDTVVPRNVRLAEAPSHGLPALQYDRASKGAQSYLQMAQELIDKQEGNRNG